MKLKLILDDEDENIELKSKKLKDSLNDSKPNLRLLTNEECYLEDSNQDESYLMEEKAWNGHHLCNSLVFLLAVAGCTMSISRGRGSFGMWCSYLDFGNQ